MRFRLLDFCRLLSGGFLGRQGLTGLDGLVSPSDEIGPFGGVSLS